MVRYLGVAAILAVAIGCTGDAKPSDTDSTTPAATTSSTPADNASADTLTPVSFTIKSELK